MKTAPAGIGAQGAEGLGGAGIGYALVSALGFSTLGIFATKLYGFGLSVPQTLAWRFSIASLFLWSFLGIRSWVGGKGRKGGPGKPGGQGGPVGQGWSGRSGPSGRSVAGLLLLALVGFTPQAGLYFLTVKLLAPGITSLLLYLYPAFVLLLTALFLKRKPSAGQLAALALSFLGCVVTFFAPGSYPLTGLLLAVLVAFAYGAYLVWGEKIFAKFDSFFSTAVLMTVAGASYWTWVILSGMRVKAPSGPEEWAFVAAISLLATVLPITALFAAMRRSGAANTSLVSTVEPVITILVSSLFLGEELTVNRILGGLLIIGGVVMLRLLTMERGRA